MSKLRTIPASVKPHRNLPDPKFLPLIVSHLLKRVADLEECVSDLRAEVDRLRRPSVPIMSAN